MAFSISETLELLKDATGKVPQIIIKIENIPIILGANEVQTIAKFDMEGIFFDQDNLFFDDVVIEPNSRDYISLNGTTTNITQQLLQDQGGTSSITQFKANIVNKNREISDLFVSGVNTDDILASNAEVYFTFQGSSFPEDAIKITNGIIAGFEYGTGYINISISHPEELKRQDIYTKIDTELGGAIDDTTTTVILASSVGLLETADNSTLYIRVEDEVMEVTGIAGNTLTVIRGSVQTVAAAHDDETEVSTVYRLQDSPLDMALKLMLSGGNEYFTNLTPRSFVSNEGQVVANAVFFDNLDIKEDLGLTVGDILKITGATNPENNTAFATIIDFGYLPASSYVVLSGVSFIEELSTSALVEFKSQYNLYSSGLGMKPFHVDVEGFNSIRNLFGLTFPDYDFLLDDTIDGKSFIDENIFFPIGLYSLPRKGRVSVGYTSPPLSTEKNIILDENTVVNLDKLKIERSISNYFYNSVVIRYNKDLITDKYLSGEVYLSADSTNRIPIKNKPLVINSDGLRKGAVTINALNRFSEKILERYKFGAQKISNVITDLKTGFVTEVGDIVVFGGDGTQLIDPDTGEFLTKRLMEVINKKLNIKTGEVSLDLLNTAYDINGRFGVIAPSSLVDSGATTTLIPLKKSFGTGEFTNETTKWSDLVGTQISFHNEDYSVEETSFITGISVTKPDTLEIFPALSSPSLENTIIDIYFYGDTIEEQELAKATYAFVNPSVAVSSGTSNFIFEVSSAVNLFVGATIKVHNGDFTNNSEETIITDITSNTITVESDLGFTPSSGDFVELVGFLDVGNPYRFI